MTEISLDEAKSLLEELRAVCLKLQKCQSLPPEDLKGKYRKAHEAAISESIGLTNRCMKEIVPWGIAVRQSCRETFRMWLDLFVESEEYQRRLRKLKEQCTKGDYDGITEFLRWFRGKVAEVAATGGAVKQEGAKLFEV